MGQGRGVLGVLADRRPRARGFVSLVQCSRGARTRTQKRPMGSKRDSASAHLRCGNAGHEGVATTHQPSKR